MKIERNQLKNLLNSGNLTRVPQLNREQKAFVREQFMQNGMSSYRYYNRCGSTGDGSGFDEWEIRGINGCIDDFCREHKLPLFPDEEKRDFYPSIKGYKNDFAAYMHDMGMCKVTLLNRFEHWNFFPWELRGVRAIVEQIVGAEC